MKNYKIAVAGTGYVGLSLGVLLSQHHQVVAVDIVQAKVDMINNKKSPIQDDYIAICVLGIMVYWDVIPLRRWYRIFKARVYGSCTRLKIYTALVIDKILQHFDT